MKVDWSQNMAHRDALLTALGFETLGANAHHLSVVGADEKLLFVMAYHNFAESNCEVSAASFGNQTLAPRAILAELLSYPFFQLGLRRITAIIRADNQRSLEQTRRMGFRVEGLLRNWYPDCHGILHGLLREDFKWAANLKRQPRQIQ